MQFLEAFQFLKVTGGTWGCANNETKTAAEKLFN